MTLSDPIVVAFIRGLLTALGQAVFTGIVTYQATGSGEDAVLVGALTFLSALGIRGGVEGVYDQRKSKPDVVFEEITREEAAGLVRRNRAVTAQEGAGEEIDPEVGYHFSPKNGKRHRGVSPTDCAVCVHDGFVQ